MINKLFQNFFRILALTAFGAVIYLNIIVVPAGNVALLVDKVNGLQKPYLQAGYHWNWTGFVPKKWKLYTLDLSPQAVSLNFKHPLRYSEYLKNPEKYTYTIRVTTRYTLNEEAVNFFWDLLESDIYSHEIYIKEMLKLRLQTLVLEALENSRNINQVETFLRNSLIRDRILESQWEQIVNAPGVTLNRLEISDFQAPDTQSYLSQISQIDRIIEAEKEATIQNIRAQSRLLEKKLMNQADLEKAEKFSRLLKDNPALLQYYRIEKINPNADIYVVPDFPYQLPQISPNSQEKKPAVRSLKPEERGQLPPFGSNNNP